MQLMDHKPLQIQSWQLEMGDDCCGRQRWLDDETPSMGQLSLPAPAMASSCCGRGPGCKSFLLVALNEVTGVTWAFFNLFSWLNFCE